MRHVWGLLGAVGLLVAVGAGTIGALGATSNEPSAPAFGLVTLGAIGLIFVAAAARGEGGARLASAGRLLGSLGLVVAPIAGILALLATLFGAPEAGMFLALTLGALLAWSIGAAISAGLPMAMTFKWLALLSVGAAVGAVALVGAVSVTSWTGLGDRDAIRASFAFVVTLGLALYAAAGKGRPDRRGAPMALARLSVGRVKPGDMALLGAGPRALLTRRRLIPPPLAADAPGPVP